MPTGTINKTYIVPGTNSRTARVTRTADNLQIWGGTDAPITLNAAKDVIDFAEGSPNEATCNLSPGHGLSTGTYDIYWTEAGVNKIRYGVSNAISTNACTLTGGAGDDYPSSVADGLVVICEQKEVAAAIDGDEVALFWVVVVFANVLATGRGHVDYQEDNDTQVGEVNVTGILQGTAVMDFDIEGGATNPLTGNPIFHMQLTHNDTTYTPTFEQTVLADSTA